MKEKIHIIIEDLDDIQNVLSSVELLFQKLIYYYIDNDFQKLNILVLSCSSWFGKILRILGYTEEDFKNE